MQHVFKYSLLTALILSTSSQAEEGFRQHDAHVHGHVEFNIAQDGNELLIEITAPGSDVVGFEHAPMDEQQHNTIEKAEHTLEHFDTVLQIPSVANCTIEHTSVSNTLESEDQHGDHEGHDDHDDHEGHDDHDDHEGHDDHDDHEGHDDHDDHEGHEHKDGEHGEFTIEYHFNCSDIAKLQHIETTWFEHFPKTDKIAVNLLTDTTQKVLELNKNNRSITF